MPVEQTPDQTHPTQMAKALRCLNCGNERLITNHWLKEISSKLLLDSSDICKSDITKYSDRFCCSKCGKKNSIFIDIKKQIEPTIPIEKKHSGFITKNKNEDYLKISKKETYTSELKDAPNGKIHGLSVKLEDVVGRKFYELPVKTKEQPNKEADLAALKKKKENAEAALRMASRQSKREKGYFGTSIPEYEEGAPRSEFGTRQDHKKMRARDWGDMQRRHGE